MKKMKKLLVLLVVLAMAGSAEAVLIQDGDFETPGNIQGLSVLTEWSAGDSSSDGAYGMTSGRTYFVLGEGPLHPGVFSAPWPLGLGGGDTVTISVDMIGLTIVEGGRPGLKLEYWTDTSYLGNGGEKRIDDITADWETYSWEATIKPGSTHYKVVLLGDWITPGGGLTGYDNVTMVPEPATLALLGLGGLLLRRRK